jgi:thioredoxin-like negative regulator of GroEL
LYCSILETEAVLSEEVTVEQFVGIVEKGVTIVVLHCRDWSGPCRRLLSVLAEVAGDLGFACPIDGGLAYSELKKGTYFEGKGEKGHIVRISADKSEAIAKKYDLRFVPSIYYFKDGRPIAVKVGFTLPDDIRRFVLDDYPKKDYVVFV